MQGGGGTYVPELVVDGEEEEEEEASSEDGICGDRFGFGFGRSRELLASSMSDSSLAREYIKTRAAAYRVSIFHYFTTYSSSSLEDNTILNCLSHCPRLIMSDKEFGGKYYYLASMAASWLQQVVHMQERS